ncbi:chemotaxis protein CheA [Pseudobacteriovorax antillogorgiicola]|uniref:Chemotaxis protein CheA n=1 Tax=Pseudobacteriovorax antillogorgiicola TaxID=1513793 RepID=A0A1Y6C412_9BACT|nr:chemotaxis protein CheA [Pseudobacteriovorax antillogorgiicola]TCS51286.1 two-component system chemotaxis sensor kinase CheA [Pseudobacteriovorax antillogorgiicola]SMF36148.1 two-component system, chemotaxis family, sensor kinase CheA [Pseudobacteriovorax antillogorgiicola]
MGQVFDNSEMELLIQTFLGEADEFIEEMEAGLLSLEDGPDDSMVIDQVFRAAHSLKGSSMAVGLNQVGKFTHEVEALLLKVKEHQIPASRDVISVLLKCNDHIKTMIETLKENLNAEFDSDDLFEQLRLMQGIDAKKAAPTKPATGFGFFDDDEDEPKEEPKQAQVAQAPQQNSKPTPEPPSEPEKRASQAAPAQRKKPQEQIKVSQERIDRLVNNIGEMAILLTVLEEQMYQFAGTNLESTVKQLYKISKDVQDVSVSLRMLPVKPIFQKMRRIVRDTSAKLGKQVNFVVIGEDVEVDKSILDLVGDPLVHIIRNAVDHGIEMPDIRQGNSKDPEGTITLRACHESGRLVFYIEDDGGGIDAERVRKKAIGLGIITENQKMSTQDLHNLIFHPGFSTKDQVTDISGRGVGMDVVNNNIKQMSGEIEIRSELGKGSRFKITLPQTFSIIEGTVVLSGEDKFVIPLGDIQESVKVTDREISKSTALGEVLTLRGDRLPVFRFEDLFEVKEHQKPEEQIALIAKSQEKNFAIVVDEILGRQQIVIKNLGNEVQSLKEFSGSTILGDGKPALIVELANLIKRKAKPDLHVERISA